MSDFIDVSERGAAGNSQQERSPRIAALALVCATQARGLRLPRNESVSYPIGEWKLLVSISAPTLMVCLPMIFEKVPPNCQTLARAVPCSAEFGQAR